MRRNGVPALSASRARPRLAIAEIGILLALVQSYLWLWAGRLPGGIYLVSAAVLGFAINAARIRREGPGELGIRLDNLSPALRDALILTAVPVTTILALGMALGTVRPDWMTTVLRLPWLVVWGFLQQFVLQAFVHRRMMEIVKENLAREVATAAFFALCHLPNWRLMIATFIGGWIWAVSYRRNPNLIALALSHALASAAVSTAFGPALLHGMKVGWGYFAYVPPRR